MSIKGALVALLALAALAAPAGANVQVGSSGWQWGNPLPQGNTLHELSFAGATGYAAGDFGTLLKTTDGGATWSGLPVGTFQSLSIVQAVDANTVVAGGGCVARRSTDGGQTFSSIAFAAVESSCKSPLRDMSFVSATLGFLLLEDGSVYTTTDGGTQFTPLTAVPGTPAAGGGDQAAALTFTSPTAGFAATSTKLYRTTDGGVSWTFMGDGLRINRLRFFDALHGFGIGPAGFFMRTEDGGQNWTAKDLGAGGLDYRTISCGTAKLCVLGNASGSQLVRTTDAGDTPGTVVTPSTDPIHAAAFASATRVAAVGANGSTVVSNDAGVTFAAVGGRLTGSYSAIVAGKAAGTAFAPGRAGTLAKTTDSGASWTRGNVPTSSDLSDVSFPSATTGYALDADGGLFATVNGGASWKTLGTGSTRRPLAVLAPSPDVVLVVGPTGVRRSVDGGTTFDQVDDRDVKRARLTNVTSTPDGVAFAYGSKTVVRSTDEGASWTVVNKPGATARIRARLFVVDAPIQQRGIAASGGNVDYLLAGDAGLLSSTTGGSTGAASTLTLSTKKRRLPKAKRITVTGRLSPAGAPAQVIVSMLPAGAKRWVHQTVQASSNGAFASAWSVHKGVTAFVAQWAGDFKAAGAGSRVMTVEVKPPVRRHRR